MARLKPRKPPDAPSSGGSSSVPSIYEGRWFMYAVIETYEYNKTNRSIMGLAAQAQGWTLIEELRKDLWTNARRFWTIASKTSMWAFPYSVDGVAACYRMLQDKEPKERKRLRLELQTFIEAANDKGD